MRYYDQQHNRLIYIAESASPEYWDHHWQTSDLRKEITKKHFDRLVIPMTKKYLPAGSRVLEGGCGTGVHVYGLKKNGFESVGVDNAPETVRLAKEAVPEMDIRLDDVLHLDFPDDYFDGYWSIGVIEHFWDGYNGVLTEMGRVIKPSGYLFLTFPYMSPLRKWKARRNKFPLPNKEGLGEIEQPTGFYQFALDHKSVVQTFEAHGFKLVQTKPFDGFKGLTDENVFANHVLGGMTRGTGLFGKTIKVLCAILFALFAGHSVLLVLQQKK